MIGKTFGRWTITSRSEDVNYHKMWVCLCSCGSSRPIRETALKSGRSLSCGCESNPQFLKVHGMSGHPLYGTWKNMVDRCYDVNFHQYPDYGGRGITVCERWRNSVILFVEDMGERPFPKAQIDRKRNNEGYSPDNCRWSTSKENNRNRRNNRIITFGGKTHCLAEWSEILGLPVSTIKGRLRRNWSTEKVLS